MNRLVNLQIEEISGVDKAANKRRFLVVKRAEGGGGMGEELSKGAKPMKTEDGVQFPAEAYLYVPDPDKPSTWKLRIWEDPEKKVTAAQVGRAIAALSPGGFRGRQVDLPAEEIPKIKAKLRRLWREVNPDKDESEMPDTIKKQGFLSRVAEGLRVAFGKAGAQTFSENMAEANVREHFWRATDALRFAIENIMADEELQPTERAARVAEALGQFQEYVMGLIGGAAVAKVGAKISAARLERLKQAHELLGQIIAEAEGTDGVQKGDEEVTKEELEALVDGKVSEVAKRLDPLAEIPARVDDLAKRVEALEKAKGTKKSVEGQDETGENVKKKSLWSGIL